MSEYQYLAFRAVDAPLSDEALEYARDQSTRAEITRWSFENEYHFGDFHGDAAGLLRHGYDVHIHFSSYGLRRAMIRFPNGLPFTDDICDHYLRSDAITWSAKSFQRDGILTIEPLWEDSYEYSDPAYLSGTIEDLVRLRDGILRGDPRMLYFLWLCSTTSEDQDAERVIEPAVPSGLGELANLLEKLMDFFSVDSTVLEAAAEGAPESEESIDETALLATWLEQKSDQQVRKLMAELISEKGSSLKQKLWMEAVGRNSKSQSKVHLTGRSLQDLFDRSEEISEEAQRQLLEELKRRDEVRARAMEQQRKERIAEMANDPQEWLDEIRFLLEYRKQGYYNDIAEILADFREAFDEDYARTLAEKILTDNPRLSRLKSAISKEGLC